MKQIFLSYRSEALSRWRDAFPTAEIRVNFEPGMLFAVSPHEKAVIWLHPPAEAADLAEQIRQVKALAPACPVVILSNLPSEAEGLTVFSAGAAGYCNALAVPELLRQVATVVEQGGLWIGQDLIKRLFGAMSARSAATVGVNALAALSPREAQVARAVARGATNKEMAHAMGITERTIKAHLSTIFDKLGVRDRLQLSLVVNGVEASTASRSKKTA
jgi:DNA-binding NarL/FixJ family response regulator